MASIPSQDTVNADALEDVTPLDQTAIDTYGRRSMAYRQQSTGKIVTYTEIVERTLVTPDNLVAQNLMRRWFRRVDRLMCWALFEHVRPQILRSVLQTLSTPFMLLHLSYIIICFQVESWKAGR